MSEARESAGKTPVARPALAARTVPTGVGAVCVAAWLGLIVSQFAGISHDEESGLFVTILIMLITVLAAASSWLVRGRARIIATVSAVLYVSVVAYLRFGFDRTMPDVMLWALTAVFYLSPFVTGSAALVAGRRGGA